MCHARIFIRLSLIFLIVQSASCKWEPNNRKKEVLCETRECEVWGNEYRNNMDTDVNPCEDFYTFTCGNWSKNHPGPKYYPEWSVLDMMTFDITNIIRQTLESYNVQSGGNKMFRRAKEVYDTCIQILFTAEYPRKEANEIAREIMKIGRVPNTPLWDIHNMFLKLTGESAFFRIKVLAGKASESIPVLMVMEPHSAYGSIYHKAWKPQEKKAYTDFLFLIIKSLRLTGSDILIKKRIEEVFEFRKQLDQIIEMNVKRSPDTFNPVSGLQLDLWFLDILEDQTDTQDIPWTEVVDVLLQNLPVHMRERRKLIAMRQKGYFLDLMDLLADVPADVLGHHMEIYFIERHLIMKENMIELLEATSIEPHDLFRYIREKYYPRWQTCIANHNMPETLEKLLFYKWFRIDNAQIVRQINSRIKIAIENQMKKSQWLGQLTREKTMTKLNGLEEWFGFPPWITEGGNPKERDKKDILTPNASLNIVTNLLNVHAALLLPPMFSPTIPALYNYASIGATLGHELYHVIDDCGSYQRGNEKIVWWSPEMRSKCLRNKLRFIDMYNNVTDREFKNRYNMNVKSDTSSTVMENIPDVMGLEAAYEAYKELATKKTSGCQTLPQFEKYNCDQMFYIAFANSYCGYNTQKSAKDKLETWVHSIDSIRINGAVAQMERFGTAFGCPIDTPMHPRERVNLWQ